jgi:uracil-DNA glycosylase
MKKFSTQCQRCPELRLYCQKIGTEKRRAYFSETYWAKPVPSFGDKNGELLIVGLAPGAHGANRTGRLFTGDESGRWLYQALYDFGYANQAVSSHHKDGLILKNAFITNVIHCAPPQNKPSLKQIANCRDYFTNDFLAIKRCKTILTLGKTAFDETIKVILEPGAFKTKPKFQHGLVLQMPFSKLSDALKQAWLGNSNESIRIVASYHPSQQNTFTKKLTQSMWDEIFQRLK